MISNYTANCKLVRVLGLVPALLFRYISWLLRCDIKYTTNMELELYLERIDLDLEEIRIGHQSLLDNGYLEFADGSDYRYKLTEKGVNLITDVKLKETNLTIFGKHQWV